MEYNGIVKNWLACYLSVQIKCFTIQQMKGGIIMYKIKNAKMLLSLVLLVSLFSLTFVSAAPIEVKEVPPEVLEEFKRLSEENVTDEELVIKPMAIECPNCNGYITTKYVGAGDWYYVGSTTCRQHANCAIKKYERHLFYEERCGGNCGYVRRSSTPEYKYIHDF